MDSTLEYKVIATALVRAHRLDEEDAEVPGEHTIRVPQAWESWPEEKLAGAILDQFHECVAVNVLEHFEFCVIAPDGRELSEF